MADLQLFQVWRYASGSKDTLGALYHIRGETREFLCYTLEDAYRVVKISGETRVPAGTYRMTLRTEGGFHAKYKNKFPSSHKGMIWIRDVPNFEYVLMHIGNTREDTAGCLLLGDSVRRVIDGTSSITDSRSAYIRVYPRIRDAILAGDTYLQYVDFA